MRYAITFIFIFHFLTSKEQKLNIRVLSDQFPRLLIITCNSQNYELWGDSVKIPDFSPTDEIYTGIVNDSVEIKTLKDTKTKFKRIELRAKSPESSFTVNTVDIKPVHRSYTDDLVLYVEYSNFVLLNRVELDNYVAGVVESEGGPRAEPEYYKTQAVLCRTYALQNLNRHVLDGYNLCDDVHCQAYKGKCNDHAGILAATRATRGYVITDQNMNLITAGFYSNCGGQTANSADVWSKPLSYLISVKDTFCITQRNARWTKTIPLSKWVEYLQVNGFKNVDSIRDNLNFDQTNRKSFYVLKNDSIALKKIRTDWNLRSAFFDIVRTENEIILNGKGYGHGVGLCQEGAMKMAKDGYNYKKIISYYYRNTKITDMNNLPVFDLIK